MSASATGSSACSFGPACGPEGRGDDCLLSISKRYMPVVKSTLRLGPWPDVTRCSLV